MSYRETATRIKFNMIDETAKDDAAFDAAHSPVYQWCDLDTLTTGGESSNYLTNEHNYCILDGSINDIDYVSPIGAQTYAFVSSFISNENRTFDSTYYFRIIFDNAHSSNGITITFDNDFLPDKIRVVYYNSTDNNRKVIYQNEYTVDENIFFCNSNGTVENYKEIRIYFISTKYPNSLIKMSNIEFGVEYVWGDGGENKASILTAEIVEESDIISNTLSIGTFRFTVYSDDDDFNIDNPNNVYSSIRINQSLDVYEIIRVYNDNNILISTDEIFMGQYYVKKWNATEKHSIEFECVDLIGLIDEIPYYDSTNVSPETFGDVISRIKKSINMGNDIIQIQDGLINLPIVGILPVCTCREALQIACFAICGYATCNRIRNIYISRKTKNISYYIKDENNFGIINSNIKPLVTGIKYPSIVYIESDTQNVVFCQKEVKTGNNQVIIVDNFVLPQSFANIHINTERSTARGYFVDENGNRLVDAQGIPLVDQYPYAHKIIMNITRAGKLIIDGQPSEKNIKTFIEKFSNNIGKENIIDISNVNAYMSTAINEDDIATLSVLEEYYLKRNSCEYEFRLTKYNNGGVAAAEQSGNWCVFKNMYNEYICGNIFSMTIDLTGGFIAKVKFVCCENIGNMTSNYICGNEIISGEIIGII